MAVLGVLVGTLLLLLLLLLLLAGVGLVAGVDVGVVAGGVLQGDGTVG